MTVFASANDPSWQVRRSVAQALAYFPTPRGTTIARQLLADRSAEVRRAVIDSLEGWSLGQSGAVLLTAMAEAPFATRKHAAEQLARRWPPALEFSSDAPNDRRGEQLTALEETWRKTQLAGEPWAIPMPPNGSTGEVAKAPNSRRRPWPRHHQVLDNADPLIEMFDQLAAEDVQIRRAAAQRTGGPGYRQPARRGDGHATGRCRYGGNRSARVGANCSRDQR